MQVKNGSRTEKNGWICITISGNPYERGFAYGELIAAELINIFAMLEEVMFQEYGYSLEMFRDIAGAFFGPQVKNNHIEYLNELKGITDGANKGGAKLTLDDIIFWNCFVSIDSLMSTMSTTIKTDKKIFSKYGHLFQDESGAPGGHSEGGGVGGGDHCTGFMAVGSYTSDGKIVCGHNTFDNFITGQYFNVILDITPDKGARILMQTAPGNIASGTDFYVTSNGFMCLETTIGGFNKFELKDPIFCRIRKAMQYGTTLDEIAKHLTTNNSGDYANSWLIGDTNNNIIMRVELGLKYVNIEKKTDGFFIGYNGADDPRIRNLECSNVGYFDMRRHQGARKVRLGQLMEEHKGKIDVNIGQDIMADHYDVYLEKINPCSRTCCSHYELDNRAFMSDPSRPKPFQPRGALDGKVCDSDLTKRMSFMARWGSSCGTPFDKTAFCKKNTIWNIQEPFLHNRPKQPWTEFSISHKPHNNENKISKRRHIKKHNTTKKK